MKYALLPLIVLLAHACGSATLPIASPIRPIAPPRPPAPTEFRFSHGSNRAAAEQNVRRLLHIIVMPAGTRRVAKIPAAAPVWFRDEGRFPSRSLGVVSKQRIWVVDEPLKQVVLFIQSHARPRPRPEALYRTAPNRIGSRPSRSYEFPPIPGRSWSRWLNVDMAALPSGATAVFARAGDEWVQAPPRSAVIPKSVRRIDITSKYGKHRASVVVHVRRRYDVSSIVAWTNGLGVSSPRVLCFGGLVGEVGPLVNLTFRAADGTVLARASVADVGGSGRSGPCNTLQLTVGGKKAPPLIGADLLLRIQRLLNVDLAPPRPRDVAFCLKQRHGWKVTSLTPTSLGVAHDGAHWRITFHHDGAITKSRPTLPTLGRCLRRGRRYGIEG